MTKVMTEYEKDKQDRKQKMVRNEFLYYGNSAGKYVSQSNKKFFDLGLYTLRKSKGRGED